MNMREVDGVTLEAVPTAVAEQALRNGHQLRSPNILLSLHGSQADLESVLDGDHLDAHRPGLNSVLLMVSVTHRMRDGEETEPTNFTGAQEMMAADGKKLIGDGSVCITRNLWPGGSSKAMWGNRRGKVWLRGNQIQTDRLWGTKAIENTARAMQACTAFGSHWTLVVAYLPLEPGVESL